MPSTENKLLTSLNQIKKSIEAQVDKIERLKHYPEETGVARGLDQIEESNLELLDALESIEAIVIKELELEGK